MGYVGKREDPRKKYICKHCKVQVVGPKNTRAIYGHEHKKCCPRKDKV